MAGQGTNTQKNGLEKAGQWGKALPMAPVLVCLWKQLVKLVILEEPR